MNDDNDDKKFENSSWNFLDDDSDIDVVHIRHFEIGSF